MLPYALLTTLLLTQAVDKPAAQVLSLAVAPDSQRVAIGWSDGHLSVWSLPNLVPQQGQRWLAHQGALRAVAFSPTGNELVSAAADGAVRLWNPTTGKATGKPYPSNAKPIHALLFSRQGDHLIRAGDDLAIRLTRRDGSEERVLRGHLRAITALALSPDGQTLASASNDETIRLWDVASGRLLRRLEGHERGVFCVAFAPDGKTLVSGGEDRTIRLWSLATGQELRVLTGQRGSVRTLAFTLDGSSLYSGGDDGAVILWNMAAAKLQRIIGEHRGTVTSICLTPDGKTLLSGDSHGKVNKLDLGKR